MHDPLSDEERDYIDDQAYGHNKNAGRIVVTGVQKARGCDGDVADQGERNDAHDPLLGYLSGNVGFDFLPGFVFGLDRAYRIADDGHEVAAGPLRGLEDFRKVAHVVDMGAAPKVQKQAFDGDVQAGLQDNVAEFRDNEGIRLVDLPELIQGLFPGVLDGITGLERSVDQLHACGKLPEHFQPPLLQ